MYQRGMGATGAQIVFTPSTCPSGFTWGAQACPGCPGGVAAQPFMTCVDPTGQDIYAHYDHLSQITSLALPAALLLLLPGWSKLLAGIALFTGVPGLTWPDGTLMFRGAFYGGL